MYYLYKERYKKEKDVLNKKSIKKFDYAKLRVIGDYQCESEEEEKQPDKKPDKKEPPKNPTKTDVSKKKLMFQKPTAMLKVVYNTDSKRENNDLVNLIKSGLSNLKDEMEEEMSKNEIEIEQPNKIVAIVEKILDFNNQNQEGQGLKILTPDQMIGR